MSKHYDLNDLEYDRDVKNGFNPHDSNFWDDYIDRRFEEFQNSGHSYNLERANPIGRLAEMEPEQQKEVLNNIKILKQKESLAGSLGVAKTAAVGAAAGLALFSQATRTTNLGSFNANILQYSPGKPYLTITRKEQYNPNNLGKYLGRPSNQLVTLEEGLGFVKVNSVHLEIPNATKEELNEIEELLKKGVIL